MPAYECTKKLEQPGLWKGRRSFEVFEGGLVRVNIKRWFSSESYTTRLDALKEDYEEVRSLSIVWLLATVVFMVLTCITLTLGNWDFSAESISLGLLFMSMGLLCLWQFLRKSNHWIIFKNRQTGADAVLLFPDSPNRQEVERFVKALSKKIADSYQPKGLTDETKMHYFIEQIRFLHEQGYLEDSEARAAANRVVSKYRELQHTSKLH